MRKSVIAGNWKMNNDLGESQKLVSEILNGLGNDDKCDVIVCPPFTSLNEVYSLIKDTNVKLGAQNMYFKDNGAFTGEISAGMLKAVGCDYVIIGHSERRTYFGETDELINDKIRKAISCDLRSCCLGRS